MKNAIDDDYADDDFDGDLPEGIEDFEATYTAPLGSKHNWRRIELLKEKMWLKNQLQDFNDW